MDTSSIPGLELMQIADVVAREKSIEREEVIMACLLYTSPSPRDMRRSRMPSSA